LEQVVVHTEQQELPQVVVVLAVIEQAHSQFPQELHTQLQLVVEQHQEH
jgi:hypothetical protein